MNKYYTENIVKRNKKLLGYLWISLYFILKEGYRQIYKLNDERFYNIKVQLKEIKKNSHFQYLNKEENSD